MWLMEQKKITPHIHFSSRYNNFLVAVITLSQHSLFFFLTLLIMNKDDLDVAPLVEEEYEVEKIVGHKIVKTKNVKVIYYTRIKKKKKS